MASLSERRPENIAGDFFVDRTCIDCDTCRAIAPQSFQRDGEQSAVYHQPETPAERRQALYALLACPTASIGTIAKPTDIRDAQADFPLLVDENVYHCGYHSELSFGAASYLILRPDGNLLIDSPRFTPPLVKRLEALGGVRYMYLTHRDDVADHQKFHDHFGCDRLLHTDDITPATANIEIPLTGTAPIVLAALPDVQIIPVPGHTRGHTVALYRDRYLFTGDHLAWSPRLEQLYAFARFCWYDWAQQIESMQRLTQYTFEWVLPGHGRRYHGTPAEVRSQLQNCVTWMQTAAATEPNHIS